MSEIILERSNKLYYGNFGISKGTLKDTTLGILILCKL